MKAIIIYFTGTYNTLHLVNKIKSRFADLFKEINVFSLDSDSKSIDLHDYDLIIFSYPIYAFNMPNIFFNYIKKLKLPKSKDYIIAKQSGEPLSLNDSSSYPLIRLIKKSKGNLKNEYHFLYPYNIHFRYDDNFIKELFNYNDKLLDILIYEYKNNIIIKINYNPFYGFNSFIFKIQRLGGPINSKFYKVDYSKCIHCNKCLLNCPTKNITLINNKYKFNTKCVMCMRCSFYCPKDAIEIGLFKSWKVNGKYDLNKIEESNSLDGHYLKNHTSKFFKLFPKKIKKIEDLHNKYFNLSK